MRCVHVPAPDKEYNHCVLQTCTNKTLRRDDMNVAWKLIEKKGMGKDKEKRIMTEMIEACYLRIQICQNKTHYSVQLISTNKNDIL